MEFVADRPPGRKLSNLRPALAFLRRALDAGYATDYIALDPDLESLHGDPEFETIVAEVKKRIGEE